jgi:hypothetical protein
VVPDAVAQLAVNWLVLVSMPGVGVLEPPPQAVRRRARVSERRELGFTEFLKWLMFRAGILPAKERETAYAKS